MRTLKEIDEMKIMGKKYERDDAEGKALGCLYPIYLVHPDFSVKFDWWEEGTDILEYYRPFLNQYTDRISEEEMKPGDILVLNLLFGIFHFGVYLGEDWIIHENPRFGLEMIRHSVFKHRIEGRYRFKWLKQ
jgi:cell wall-associated NlpC family hydrolase